MRAAPTTPYDIPLWCEPKVPRGQLAQVAKALYSLQHPYAGHTLTARADQQTVRFYDRHALVKTHPRQSPGGRIDRFTSNAYDLVIDGESYRGRLKPSFPSEGRR